MTITEQFITKTQATLNVKGKIKAGYYVVSATCPACKKTVTAIKPYNDFICPDCGGIAVVAPGAEPRTVSIDYFILPADIASESKQKTLRVLPAYTEIDKVVKLSYSKKGKGGKILCRSIDGINTDVLQFNEKKQPMTVQGKCNGDACNDRKTGYCKLGAAIYFILPDVDMFAAYVLYTRSTVSVANIISTLKMLVDRTTGLIRRDPAYPLVLSIEQAKRASTGTSYNIFKLSLPQINAMQLQQQGGGHSGHLLLDTPTVEIAYDGLNSEQAEVERVIDSTPVDPRVIEGRKKMLAKAAYFIPGDKNGVLFKKYACDRYKVGSFEELTVEQLLQLWRELQHGSNIVDCINIQLIER